MKNRYHPGLDQGISIHVHVHVLYHHQISHIYIYPPPPPPPPPPWLQSEAVQQYCRTVEDLASAEQASSSSRSGEAGPSGGYEEIAVTDEGGARTIMLNRPHKYNAITYKVCGAHFCLIQFG